VNLATLQPPSGADNVVIVLVPGAADTLIAPGTLMITSPEPPAPSPNGVAPAAFNPPPPPPPPVLAVPDCAAPGGPPPFPPPPAPPVATVPPPPLTKFHHHHLQLLRQLTL